MTALPLGIRENLTQFTHLLIQVLVVGFAIGMMRTVIPALAETELGVARGSFLLLTASVVALCVVQAVTNFVAARLSEHIGRQRVLFGAGPLRCRSGHDLGGSEPGVDRRGGGALGSQAGCVLVGDLDIKGRHLACRSAWADDGAERVLRLRRRGACRGDHRLCGQGLSPGFSSPSITLSALTLQLAQRFLCLMLQNWSRQRRELKKE